MAASRREKVETTPSVPSSPADQSGGAPPSTMGQNASSDQRRPARTAATSASPQLSKPATKKGGLQRLFPRGRKQQQQQQQQARYFDSEAVPDNEAEDDRSQAILAFRAEADMYSNLAQITHFDLRTLHKLHVIFEDISASKVADGFIDADELSSAMGLQDSRSSVLARTLFRLFDITGTQQINLRTWVCTLSALSRHASLDEKIRFSFSLHDVDGNGTIEGDELRSLLVAAVHEQVLSLTPEQVAAVVDYTLQRVDLNGDGLIQYEEYAQLARQSPRFVDLFTLDIDKLCDAFRVSRRRRHIQHRLQEERLRSLVDGEAVTAPARTAPSSPHLAPLAPGGPGSPRLTAAVPPASLELADAAAGDHNNDGEQVVPRNTTTLSSRAISRLVALADRMDEGEVNRRQDAFRGEISKAAAEGKRIAPELPRLRLNDEGGGGDSDGDDSDPSPHDLDSIPRNLLVYGLGSPRSPMAADGSVPPASSAASFAPPPPPQPVETPAFSAPTAAGGPVTVIVDLDDLHL